MVSRARIRGDLGGEGDGHGDPAVLAPNSEGFRLAEAERFGPSAGAFDRLCPCGGRLGFFRYGVGVELTSRRGGGDKKKTLLVHLFMCSFVPAICPGSKHQFSAQIKGEDSFFCCFLLVSIE